MNTKTGSAKLDKAELDRLAKLYNLEDYLFEVVSQRFREKQVLEPYDFFAIVIWKSNRAKTKIQSGLHAAGKTVEELMREVSQAETPQGKVKALTQVWGIGLAMASAILTVCYPDKFTVLDYRAWETLTGESMAGLPQRFPESAEEYVQYCQACRRLAHQVGLSLRDLDRALWAKNWKDDLLELIAE
jgi:thermostable 8-oxoguanine DNA glycosylase